MATQSGNSMKFQRQRHPIRFSTTMTSTWKSVPTVDYNSERKPEMAADTGNTVAYISDTVTL